MIFSRLMGYFSKITFIFGFHIRSLKKEENELYDSKKIAC